MGDRATQSDEIAILMLASSWTTWRRAMAEVHTLGNVVMSGGTAIANPSLAVAHQAHGQILALCKELGLTAKSRKRSKSAKPATPHGLQLLAPPRSKTGA
jgi:P27 family predicted phage terminase small subunit